MKKTVIVLLILIISISCQKKKVFKTGNMDDNTIKLSKEIKAGSNKISDFFDANCFVLYREIELHRGTNNIQNFYKTLFSGLTLEKIIINHHQNGIEQSGYFYEIGEYIFTDKSFIFLAKWIKTNGELKKEFEVIAEKNYTKNKIDEIECCHQPKADCNRNSPASSPYSVFTMECIKDTY